MPSTSFGPYTFDTTLMSLTRDGDPVAINARGAALLAVLLDARGGVVGRDALLEAGWPGLTVDEANLTVQIGTLRKLLGKQPDGRDWIETVPRIGYRLPRAHMAESLPTVLPSIAVLPFANLSGDKDQDYFAEGVVEDLITALSRFKSFAVIGRPLAAGTRDRLADVRQIGEELGVRYLLDGSVRRAGPALRITAKLIDSDGATLWSKTFDGLVEEVFAFQDRITESVVALVEPAIKHAEIRRARRDRPGGIAAYDLYLRGLQAAHIFLPASNAAADALFAEALALEPDNVSFLAGASLVLQHRISNGWPPIGPDDKDRCIALARRGLSLVENNANAMATFGMSLINAKEDPEIGLAAANRAVELNPNSLTVMITAAVCHTHVGSQEDAEIYYRRVLALGLDTESQSFAQTGIARMHLLAGRYEEARQWATRSLSINEGYTVTFWLLMAANAHLGRLDEARRYLARYQALAPGVTIERIMAQRANTDPARFAPILAGLKLAGMT